MRKDAQLISLVGLILIFGVLNAAAQQNPGTGAAWGENPDGQFGNGTNTPSATPVPAVTNLSGLIAVSGGGLHSLWLKGDGTVWAAGSNGAGQLGGVGPYPGCTGPGSVTAIQVPGLSGVVAISAGFGHSMALKNDGTVWVWGSDVEWDTPPLNGGFASTCTPTQVSSLSGIVAIAAGGGHNVALKSDGTVWAWGDNRFGQLGNGTLVNSAVPIQVSNLSGVVAIGAMDQNSYAVKSDGTAWAWGTGGYGLLGNGTTTDSSTPVQVSNLSGVTKIGSSVYNVSALALKSDGTVWAWGDNTYGELGNGTTTSSTTPVQVSGLSSVTAIAVGDALGVALKSDGSVWEWGTPYSGGGPQIVRSATPVQVSNLSGATAIGAGLTSGGATAAFAVSGVISTCATAPSGLVACYPAEGNAADVIGGHNGTLVGGVTFAPGKFGQAFSLDGATGYINAGSSPAFNLGDFTLAAWVSIDPATNTGERRVISRDDIFISSTRQIYELRSSSSSGCGQSGTAAVFILVGSAASGACAPSPLSAGFHHLAGVRSGSTLSLYVDGALVASGAGFPGTISPNAPLVFGQVSPAYNGEFLAGLIDEVQIYNRALSASEIQTAMNGGAASSGPTPTSVPHVSQPIVEAAGPNGASVTLDGSGSTAPNGGALTYLWTGPFGTASGVSPTVTLPVGTSTVTLTVTDSLGHSGSSTIQITVQDTTPPVLTLPASVSLQATSVSGAVVNYSASANDLVSGAVAANCTPASGSTFAIGTTTVNCSATDAAGNTATGSFPVTVTRLSQTISFAQIANLTYGAPDFTLSATSSSALPITYSVPAINNYCSLIGFTVHIITAGICPITAQQAGDGTYLPATPVTQSFTILQATQTITFAALPNLTYGAPDFTLSATSATASSGLPVTYSVPATNNYCSLIGFTVHIITAGICPITAQQAGNGNYLAAPAVTQSFTILQATQTISFGPLANRTYGDADFPLSATSSSGLPVTFTTAYSNPYCMLIGFTVRIITAGICPITAQQPGDGNYLPAAPVTQSFTINRANAVVTVTSYSVTFDGSAHTATGTVTGVGGASLTGLNLAGTTHTNAGTYGADSWTFTDTTGNYNNASGTVQDVIGKANAVISVTPYNVTYDGHAHTAMGTATGVGGASLTGLNLTGTTHTNAGAYSADSWTFTDAAGNYNNTSGTVSDVINRANASVTPTAASKIYGTPDSGLTGTLSGFVPTDGVTATYSRTGGETVAGSPYTISATLSPAIVLGNYTITYNTAAFTIIKATLLVTADNKTKILNAANPSFTATYSGFKNGETLATSGVSGSPSLSTAATTTSPVGAYTIVAAIGTLTAANYTFTFANGTLTILYATGGMCGANAGHTILPPINADGSTVGNQGRTVPAKFTVCGADGVPVGTPGVVASFYLTQIISGTVSSTVNETVASTTPDTAFRWTGDLWIFNIDTSNLPANQTYVFTITLNDGSTIMFQFGLR